MRSWRASALASYNGRLEHGLVNPLGFVERHYVDAGKRARRALDHRAKMWTAHVAPEPPTLCVSPISASARWRPSPSPRSWRKISYTWAVPVAPRGCPLAFRPPLGFTAT